MSHPERTSTILVVDDEEVVCELLRQSLADDHRTILVASGSRQALDLITAHGELDLAVIDKNLEEISGLDLARELRSHYPASEAIIMTAAPSIESAVEAIGLKIFDYITKPFHIREVGDKVAAALEVVAQRQDRQQRLRQLYQMEAVGSLTASVAHEINNPLTYVLANLHAIPDLCARLRESSAGPQVGEIEQLAAEAREGAERIAAIVRDLRFFAHRGETDSVGAVDLDEVVESAVHFASNELRHRARLVTHLGQPPKVDGSELRLGQVVVNLLVNAVQSLGEEQDSANLIEVTTGVDDDGWSFVAVSDNGCGIPPDLRDRVFDRFFTTKAVGQGTGLGLAICKRYVEDMGGRLELESEVDRGTTLTVRLPGAGEVAQIVRTPAAPTEPEPTTVPAGKVLIIDDDTLLLRSLKRVLDGFDVTIVDDSRRAIEMLTAPNDFDVILCDLMMPGATGMDVHAAARTFDAAVADSIIFITGGVFTGRATTFRERVSNRVLDKPIDPDDLRALVAGRLRTRGGH